MRADPKLIPLWVVIDDTGAILCPKNSINPGHWKASSWAQSTFDRNVTRTCRCFDKITIFNWDDESPRSSE